MQHMFLSSVFLENQLQNYDFQVSVVRHISRSRPDDNAKNSAGLSRSKNPYDPLTKEAERNPALKRQLETLAMQYLTDSQLVETAKNQPKGLCLQKLNDKLPDLYLEMNFQKKHCSITNIIITTTGGRLIEELKSYPSKCQFAVENL